MHFDAHNSAVLQSLDLLYVEWTWQLIMQHPHRLLEMQWGQASCLVLVPGDCSIVYRISSTLSLPRLREVTAYASVGSVQWHCVCNLCFEKYYTSKTSGRTVIQQISLYRKKILQESSNTLS
jgi:hypothetical protein